MTSKTTSSMLYTERLTTEYLQLRAQLLQITPELIEVFAEGKVEVITRVAAGLGRSFPNHPDLPILHSAAHDIIRRDGDKKRVRCGPGKGRIARISIPVAETPPEFIARVRTSKYGPRIQADLVVVLREILGAARRARLPEVLDITTISACHNELMTRYLSKKTIARKILDFQRLGAIWELKSDDIARISNEYRSALWKADRAPSIRHSAFKATPLTPEDYARIARAAAEEAYSCKGGRQSIHRLFLTAAVLAFLSFLPERISDILGLVIGQSVIRDARGWSSKYLSAKTGVDRSIEYFPDQLTPYIDDLILFGADPGPQGSNLAHLYRLRVAAKSPLFARTDLQRSYSTNRIFELIKERTGHGPHAARKAMADYQAAVGGSVDAVMDLLGHRSSITAIQNYEVQAMATRRQNTSKALGNLRAELTKSVEMRLPDGRQFDLKKACRELEMTICLEPIV